MVRKDQKEHQEMLAFLASKELKAIKETLLWVLSVDPDLQGSQDYLVYSETLAWLERMVFPDPRALKAFAGNQELPDCKAQMAIEVVPDCRDYRVAMEPKDWLVTSAMLV